VIAGLVAVGLVTGAGPAGATENSPLAIVNTSAASCGWHAAAADLAAATAAATDPRAKAIHDALVKAGLSAPATCSSGTDSRAGRGTGTGGARTVAEPGAGAMRGIDDGAAVGAGR